MTQTYKTQFTASLMDGLTAYFNPALPRTHTTGSGVAYDIINHAQGPTTNVDYDGNVFIFQNSGSLFLTQSLDTGYGRASGSDQTFSIWFKPEQTGKHIISHENELFNIYLTKSHQVYLGMVPTNNFGYDFGCMEISGSELWVSCNLSNSNGDYRVYDKNSMKLKRYISSKSDNDDRSYFDTNYQYGSLQLSGSDVYIGGLRSIDKFDSSYMFNPTASAYGDSITQTNKGRGIAIKYFTYGVGAASSGYTGYITGLYMNDDYFWFGDRTNDRIQKVTRADGTYVAHSTSTMTDPYDGCADGTYYYSVDYGTDVLIKLNLSDLTEVWSYGSYGSGDANFNNPLGVVTDGTYIYVLDYSNDRIKKHNCSDGAYVAQVSIQPYNTGRVIALDLEESIIYVYCKYGTPGSSILKYDTDLNLIQIFSCHEFGNDFSYYSVRGMYIEQGSGILNLCERNDNYFRYQLDNYGNVNSPHYTNKFSSTYYNDSRGLTTDGTYVYTADENHTIVKWNYSDISYVTSVGTKGTPGATSTTFNRPEILTTDGTYLYCTDYINERLCQRDVSDLSYVNEICSYGAGGNEDLRWSQCHALSGSLLYIACRDDGVIKIYNKDTLAYVTQSGNLDPYSDGDLGNMIAVDDNYIFIGNQATIMGAVSSTNFSSDLGYIMKIDKDTLTEVASAKLTSYAWYIDADKMRTDYPNGMDQYGDYLYINSNMELVVIDKEHMSFVNRKYEGLYSMVSPDTITTGSWHNVTFTMDDTDLKLYVDDVFQVSASIAGANTVPARFETIAPLLMGQYGELETYSNMSIGEVRVYNRVLTTTEMSASHAEISTRYNYT